MNIKWYTNGWYWGAIVVVVFILVLAGFSQTVYSLGLITTEGSYKIFSIDFLFRSIFNPLWTVVLFLFEKGRRANSEKHHDILKYLQGVVNNAMDNRQKKVLTSTLANALVNYDNVEKRIKDSLNSGIRMQESHNNPIL